MEDKQRKMLIDLCVILGIILTLTIGWTVYDKNVDRSGWVQKDGVYAYQDFHGNKITGWLELGENTYYFGNDTIMVTGWRELEGNRYHFGADGIMSTGWTDLDGMRCYFGTDGILRTGWLELEGNRYYLDSSGDMLTHWQELDGDTYYFGDDGVMYTGWKVVNGDTYYFGEDGKRITGRVILDDQHYYFLDNGVMFYGWEEADDGRRYYSRDGAQVFGWSNIDEKWYLFGEDGLTMHGWHQEGEYTYYLQEDGSAAVGPLEIEDQLYYFTPRGMMVVLVNGDHQVPSYYKPELETFLPWHEVSTVALEPLTRMLEDCEAAGYPYTFNSAYRSIKVQEDILSLRTQEYMAAGLNEQEAYSEARKTVALPGTSEHHLGLAVDILNQEFAEKKALDWLGTHCWEYGFILRYAEEKAPITGIVYEPWHFRYVGREISMDMKDSGLCLEEYLGAAPVANSAIDEESSER